jgi:hypothetical protein
MNRIQFPTWTDVNGGDDMQPNWPTNAAASGTNLGGGTWHYRVNVSAHNNELGQYQTHVYLYDNIGNVSSFATSGAFLEPEVPAGWIAIRTPDDLNNIRNNLSGYYFVVNDIDLSTSAYSTWTGINNFVGKLDGGNHKIIGLKSYTGFFGTISNTNNVEIRNIEFVGVPTTAQLSDLGILISHLSSSTIKMTSVKVNDSLSGSLSDIGGFIGFAENSDITINNSIASVTISADSAVGGFIGYANNTILNMSNSYSSSTISATRDAGGLVGSIYGGTTTITNSYATGNISATHNVGGLIGVTAGGSGLISKCYASGNITVPTIWGEDYNAGGLIGQTSAKVSDCYALGNITITGSGGGVAYLGGLIGLANSTVERSYSIGKVTNSTPESSYCYIGPVVGGGGYGTSSYLYWIKETSQYYSTIGPEFGTTGINTIAEGSHASSYPGFDFTNVWSIIEGTTLPYIKGMTPAARNYISAL